MARSLSEIMASLNAQYDPSRTLINQQTATLPGEEQAAVAGLDTARTNAFTDITAQANNRGVVYSGAPIQEQQRYVGEKYLPAVASTRSDFANRRFKLQDALNSVNQEQGQRAYAMAEAEKQAEAEAAYKAQQIAISRRKDAAAGLSFGDLFGGQPAAAPAAPPAPPGFGKGTNPAVALQQLFSGYQPGQHPYYTENIVLPAIERLLAAGSPKLSADIIKQQAWNKVFSYRKKNFGE